MALSAVHPDDERRISRCVVRRGDDCGSIRTRCLLEDFVESLTPRLRDERGDRDWAQPVDRGNGRGR